MTGGEKVDKREESGVEKIESHIKATAEMVALEELDKEFFDLKQEFHVSAGKLKMLSSDGEIVECIKARRRKIDTPEEIYAYLAGPIETQGDLGVTWREWVSPRLEKIGITPLDPVKLEGCKTGLAPGETLRKIDELRRHRQWEELRQLTGKIRYVDTALIEHKASLLIAHIPLRVPRIEKERLTVILNRYFRRVSEEFELDDQELVMRIILEMFPKILPDVFEAMARGEATGGTSSEIQLACMRKIPILFVCHKKALDTFSSSWVLDAILERGRVFDNFNQLLKFLTQNIDKIRKKDEPSEGSKE